MRNCFNKVVICSCGGDKVHDLSKIGIKHITIPDIDNKNPFTIFKIMFILVKIIRNEKIDVIHTHHRMAAFYVRIISFYTSVLHIYTAHNVFEEKRKLTKFSLEKANIIAVGNEVRNNLVEYFHIKPSKITVINNSVRLNNSPNKKIKIIEENKASFMIGNIGRLAIVKGHKYFLEALKKFKDEGCNFKAFIVGEGEERSNIEAQIKRLGLKNEVILVGYRTDIQNIMKYLDVVVLCSLQEGFPLTPIEAFSMGIPVVATDAGGTKDVVIDLVNGYLVKKEDTEGLFERLLYLYRNRSQLEELGANALISYKEKFSFDIYANKYMEFYKNILEY
jgi:glycosyltransferase involved in cell wall biosynthesis